MLTQIHKSTAEHPLYVSELAKIEETKLRNLQLISELLKLSHTNVTVHHEMEVLSIEAGHNMDLLALKRQMQANLEATVVEQGQECNPPAVPSILIHQRLATQQPPYLGESEAQDLQANRKPEAGATRVFPVLERIGATQRRNESCSFDEALFPTVTPPVVTTAVKAVSRKRQRHENRKRVTGAGDYFEEENGSEDGTDDDSEGGYQDIVDIFQTRLLQKGPAVRPAGCKGNRRHRPKTTST